MIMLMQEIQGLREKNKVTNDDARKKNAESIVMRLAKWMEVSDEEDLSDDNFQVDSDKE